MCSLYVYAPRDQWLYSQYYALSHQTWLRPINSTQYHVYSSIILVCNTPTSPYPAAATMFVRININIAMVVFTVLYAQPSELQSCFRPTKSTPSHVYPNIKQIYWYAILQQHVGLYKLGTMHHMDVSVHLIMCLFTCSSIVSDGQTFIR